MGVLMGAMLWIFIMSIAVGAVNLWPPTATPPELVVWMLVFLIGMSLAVVGHLFEKIIEQGNR